MMGRGGPRPRPGRGLMSQAGLVMFVICCRLALAVAGGTAAGGGAVPAVAPEENGRIPFNVTFETPATLGLRLNNDLSVAGFSKGGAAESTGWIVPGDVLVKVNGESVEGLSLSSAVSTLSRAPLPKTLTFLPRKDGEDRAAEVRARKEEEQLSNQLGGTLEFALIGVPRSVAADPVSAGLPVPKRVSWSTPARGPRQAVVVYSWPFVQAHFGPNPSCAVFPAEEASPVTACSSFHNENDLAGAITFADRGACTFSDKAINLQVADAAGMILRNDAGPASPMPLADYERSSVLIPSVMLAEEHGAASAVVFAWLRSPDRSQHAPVEPHVRLVATDNTCPSFFPAVDASEFVPSPVESSGNGNAHAAFDWTDEEDPSASSDVAGLITFALSSHVLPADDSSVAEVAADGSVASPHHMGLPKVKVLPSNGAVKRVEFLAAEFGYPLSKVLEQLPHIPRVIDAEPRFACSALENSLEDLKGAFVLAERGGCNFVEKYTNVAATGALGIIVANTELGLFKMPTAFQDDQVELMNADGLPCTALMVTHSAAVGVRQLLSNANPEDGDVGIVLADVSPRPLLKRYWEDLTDLMTHENWPEEYSLRRKLYFKKSILHHPDRPGGNGQRFEALSYAYRRANHRWDPENVPFSEDLA